LRKSKKAGTRKEGRNGKIEELELGKMFANLQLLLAVLENYSHYPLFANWFG
jgi:hypothetical protein